MPEKQLTPIIKKLELQIKELPETLTNQLATIYIKGQYENMGIEIKKTNQTILNMKMMLLMAFNSNGRSSHYGNFSIKTGIGSQAEILEIKIYNKVTKFLIRKLMSFHSIIDDRSTDHINKLNNSQ